MSESVPPRRPWDALTQDSVRETWSTVLVAIIRHYACRRSERGKRLKMWQRVPNMAQLCAQQAVGLDEWYTALLQRLQITRQGNPHTLGSLSGTWLLARAVLRNFGDSPAWAEQTALDLLERDMAAITAMANLAYENQKTTHPDLEDEHDE